MKIAVPKPCYRIMYRIIYCFLKTIPISLAGIIQPPTLSRTLTEWAALPFSQTHLPYFWIFTKKVPPYMMSATMLTETKGAWKWESCIRPRKLPSI